MKKFAFSLALFVAASAFAQAPKPIDVDAFSTKAKSLDKKTVAVSGKVSKFKARESKKGNKYTTFVLEGKKGMVNVYLQGFLASPVKDGQMVVVTGTYVIEKKVGTLTFKNEIDATEKKGSPNGVRPLRAPAPAKKK